MRRKHSKSNRSRRHLPGQKPRGRFQGRVQQVGPERFAIVAVDPGKAEAEAMVTDFYGNVLLAPFTLRVSRPGLEDTCRRVRDTLGRHGIRDLACVVEMTGRYHRPIAHALAAQGWDTREVHPFTTSLIRQSADLGNKTDHIDLWAIYRAALDGFAMRPEALDARSLPWRLLTRHRRDLVQKAATLKIQLKETIEAYLPGFTALWDDFWDSPAPTAIAVAYASPDALNQATPEALREVARAAHSQLKRTTIDKILAWSHHAAPADGAPLICQRRARSLWSDLQAKQAEIAPLELDLAAFLCSSRFVVLLSIPGVNVVSASDYAAELGPITNYAKPNTITGRAGLYPSRYQSVRTDRADGPLVPRANRELRAALIRLARNLKRSNRYFQGLAAEYQKRQPNRDVHVVVASRFARISFHMIAGGQLFRHRCARQHDCVLDKLLKFYHEHHAPCTVAAQGLDQAARQLPAQSLAEERQPLAQQWQQLARKRRKAGVIQLGELLPVVLLRLEARMKEVPGSSSSATDGVTVETQARAHGS